MARLTWDLVALPSCKALRFRPLKIYAFLLFLARGGCKDGRSLKKGANQILYFYFTAFLFLHLTSRDGGLDESYCRHWVLGSITVGEATTKTKNLWVAWLLGPTILAFNCCWNTFEVWQGNECVIFFRWLTLAQSNYTNRLRDQPPDVPRSDY